MKSIKEKVKAKTKAIKPKVKAKMQAMKAKLKGRVKKTAIISAAFALFALTGCMTPEQASRSTRADVGDVKSSIDVSIDEKAKSNSVTITVRNTFGDGASASADSSGSTENQSQTPTFDISPKTDLRYNDALAAASTTTKGILETLTETGMKKVLAMMTSGGSGTVTVDNNNGGQTTVTCENGQCTSADCSDGSCTYRQK